MTPDTHPASEGAQRDADLAQIMDDLAAPNPHSVDLDLSTALQDDGGYS